MICHGKAELRGLACKHRLDPREADFEADQVTLALVHRDKAEAD